MYDITREWIKSEFSKNHPDFPNEQEVDKMIKERILERYVNYVFFGNNAYGIQKASQNYFWLPLDEINQKQIAILAWIVKAPTSYNPLINPKNMLWYWSINDGETTYILEEWHELTESFMAQIQDNLNLKKEEFASLYTWDTLVQPYAMQWYETYDQEFSIQSIWTGNISAIPSSDIWWDFEYDRTQSSQKLYSENVDDIATTQDEWVTDTQITKKMLESLWVGTFVNADTTYAYQYHPGRKDTVLRNRHIYGNLSIQDLFANFVDTSDPPIKDTIPSYTIQAPQFVFWVRSILLHDDRLSYLWINSHELLTKWYTIQTTLDMNLQNAAESASHQTYNNLLSYNAKNRAMLHVDSTNWEVLAYMASHNYFDNNIDGAVDMIQAQRQQGSLRKPFLFAKLLETYGMSTSYEIADKLLKLSTKTNPSNADNVYEWKMTLTKALTNSKNLPAIRIFFALWGETFIKSYLQQLGFTYILSDIGYWWPLALWTAEESMLHAAQSYLQLAHTDNKIPSIFPIQRILDPEWNVVADYTHCHRSVAIYTNENEQAVCESLSSDAFIPQWVRYQIREMLTDRSQLYSFWKPLLQIWIPWKFAIKTWTSDVKVDGSVYPRDAYTSVYTPEEVIIHRSWNNSWKPMRYNSFSATINKAFLTRYVSNTKAYYDRSHQGFKKPVSQLKGDSFISPIRKTMDRNAQKYLEGKE